MDTYPDNFREDPDFLCLQTLIKFSERHVPDSDLSSRAKHKRERFQKEVSKNQDLHGNYLDMCPSIQISQILSFYEK
jgi:hypothetical protein